MKNQRQKLEAMTRLKIEKVLTENMKCKFLKNILKSLNELEMKIMLEGIKERLRIVKESVDEEMRIKQQLYDKNLQAIKEKKL